MPKTVEIRLLSKPGCHLCEDARGVIDRVRSSLDQQGQPTAFEEVDILQDETLARLHAEEIPVVLLNGKRHAIWRVDEDRLTAAIQKAARKATLFSRHTESTSKS